MSEVKESQTDILYRRPTATETVFNIYFQQQQNDKATNVTRITVSDYHRYTTFFGREVIYFDSFGTLFASCSNNIATV